MVEVQHKHKRWESFKKVVEKVREGPCRPKDIYSDAKLNLRQRTVSHNLTLGVYFGIFRQLEDGRYVWIDYVEKEETARNLLKRFRLLYCRWPLPSEVAADLGLIPVETEQVIYKVAGSQPAEDRWREPTEEDILSAHFIAHRRLQLAAWIKLGRQASQYVKKNWSEKEFKKAEDVLKLYPDFVPRIDLLHEIGRAHV